MTNKTTHHLNQHISHQQADTPIVQQIPTSGLVLTGKYTTSGGDAGLSHYHPLDAEHIVISRVSVRKPAQQTPGHPDARPTHKRLAEKGRERLLHTGEGVLLPDPGSHSLTFSGTSSTKRPDIGDIRQTVAAPQEGRAPRDPDNSRKAFTHAKRSPRAVRQDKDRFSSDRAASLQPAAVNKFTRSQATSRKSARSKKRGQ